MKGWTQTPWFSLRSRSGRVELSAQLADGGVAPDGAGRLEQPVFQLRLDDRLALGFAPGEGTVRMTRGAFPSTGWALAPLGSETRDDAAEFERLEALARQLLAVVAALGARTPALGWATLAARGEVQSACAALFRQEALD